MIILTTSNNTKSLRGVFILAQVLLLLSEHVLFDKGELVGV